MAADGDVGTVLVTGGPSGLGAAVAAAVAGAGGTPVVLDLRTPFFDGRTERYKPGPDAHLAGPGDTARAALFALRQPAGFEIRELVATVSTEPSWP